MGTKASFLTIQEFLRARWIHEVLSHDARWSVQLPDTSVVHSHELRSVICLRPAVPAAAVNHIDGKDRHYAYHETSAALCSMLAAVKGVVVNRPSPFAISGKERSVEEWRRMAVQAGLPVQPVSGFMHQPSTSSNALAPMFVVGDEVVCRDDLPSFIVAGLRKLRLRPGGLALIDALVRVLEAR